MAEPTGEPPVSFDSFIAPLSGEEFFKSHWEQRYVHVQRDVPSFCRDLLCVADVDRYLALARNNPATVVSIVRLGREIQQVRGADINPKQLYHEFSSGSTLLFERAHLVWPSLFQLARSLEQGLSARVAVNVYMSPPGAQGAHVHPDVYDVFALHLEGSKRWWLYAERFYQVVEHMKFHPYIPRGIPKGALEREDINLGPAEELVVTPGDLLYLPRGTFHKAATPDDSPSLHLAIAVNPIYWVEVVKAAAEVASAQYRELSRVLPPGFESMKTSELADSLRQTFQHAIELLGRDGVFERTLDILKRARMDDSPAMGDGHFEQLLHLDDITPETQLERRSGQHCLVTVSAQGALIQFRGGQMNGPPHLGPAFEFIAEHSHFRVADLPGRLDDQSKLVVVKRLIREGVLRVPAQSNERT